MSETLFFFDTLDGAIGEHYWSLDDLAAMLCVQGEYTEQDAIRHARNLEATLYRCEVDNGEVVDTVTLYDPFSCFE